MYSGLDKFYGEPWFIAYGIGGSYNDPCVYIYICNPTSKEFDEYIKTVNYNYKIIKTGKIVPL